MGLGLGRVDARTAAALAEAVQAQSATYGDRSYFANRVPLVQARVMFAAGQFETAQQTLDIAWQADQQGLRLHHAQLLAEFNCWARSSPRSAVRSKQRSYRARH